MCEGGDIGRTATWNDELEHCYYQNHLHRLRKLNGQIDEHFALLYLQYAFLYARLYAGRANVTTIPNLSKSRLGELEISLPTLSEQKSIAQVLTTVQEAIAGQEELVAKLKELKRGMMQYLFTHGTKGEKTKMTEIGEAPESWEIVNFEDCLQKIKIGKVKQIPLKNYKSVGRFPIIDHGQGEIAGYTDDQEKVIFDNMNTINWQQFGLRKNRQDSILWIDD
ncbi:MAG: restriction endonuclease subunit S [bacterium]